MEGPNYPPVFEAPLNRPNSPPSTPCPYSTASHPINLNDPPPPYEQHVTPLCAAPSPPLESAERNGDVSKNPFGQAESFDSSANSSNTSSPANMEDDSPVDHSASPGEEPPQPDNNKPVVTIKDGGLDVEEITEDDIGYDSDTEVVRPDGFEEAPGARDGRDGLADDAGISRRLEELNCGDENISTDEELRRRTERRKKRWSGRQFKRTHSQSFGSDTDDADLGSLGSRDSGSHTRRLRRKLNGHGAEPGDRSSLILEDLGNSCTFAEEEQGSGGSITRPPSVPSDLEGLQALPFWVYQDRMELDSGSSGPSSSV